jgi:NAD-dependent SIR2 family protein deacetylase
VCVSEFAQAARLLEETPAILIMAGAGMGVDSGLPDYRGRQGFWRDYPPLKRLGITFDDSHDPSWFIKVRIPIRYRTSSRLIHAQDRQQSWGFYGHRAKLYSEKRPHEGYDFLLRVARSKNNNFFIFTSNIDEHFQKAGFEKQRIYECHGSLSYAQCTTPCWNEGRGGSQVWPVTVDQLPQVDEETLRVPTSDMSVYPKCPYCNELARPNVSLAGDTQDTWVPARSHGQKKRLLRWLKSVLYESKDGDAWQQRTEEEQGESDEYSEDEGESEEEEEWDSAVQQKESLCKDTQRLPPKLVVIELGCGDSIHSIRIEADVLIAENPSVRLIRINPNFRGALRDGHVAIRLGALAALQGIGRHLNKNSCPTELRRRSYESLANPIHS